MNKNAVILGENRFTLRPHVLKAHFLVASWSKLSKHVLQVQIGICIPCIYTL